MGLWQKLGYVTLTKTEKMDMKRLEKAYERHQTQKGLRRGN
jgi:hypothetical protein